MNTPYNIIIVDDEAIIRDGISSVLPWGTNGFNLIGLFGDGQQALEFIKHNEVDVVISDINMPKMDGLALSRHLSSSFPEVLILLLTGYDEFEYAQEAVRNHVQDFLLKPITSNELSVVLAHVKDELDRKKEWSRQQNLLKEKFEESFPLLKERFLQKLSTGKIAHAELSRQIDYFSVRDLSSWYQIVAIGHPATWDDVAKLTFEENVSARIKESDEYFTDINGFLCILIQEENRNAIEQKSTTLSEELFLLASRSGSGEISVGIGSPMKGIIELNDSYRGATHAVQYAKVLGMAQIMRSEKIRERKDISLEAFGDLVDDLISTIKEGSRMQSSAALETIFDYLEEHYVHPDSAIFYLSYLYVAMISFQKRMRFGADLDTFSETGTPTFDSLNQAKIFFISTLSAIENDIQARRNDVALSRVDRARSIISERYAESQFSLQDICDLLYLSVSQFSVLFKEGTGMTFVEYLTAFRMDRAKELLKSTDLRAYEVAERVGYIDPRYFSYVFKKATGMTTREYQRSMEE